MTRQANLNLLIAALILAGVAFQAMLGFPGFRDVRNWWHADRYRAQCGSNLKNLATACDMYAMDNGGHDPASLRHVVPNYLKTLPTCPTVGAYTYSATHPIDVWQGYTITCSGDHRGPPVERLHVQVGFCGE